MPLTIKQIDTHEPSPVRFDTLRPGEIFSIGPGEYIFMCFYDQAFATNQAVSLTSGHVCCFQPDSLVRVRTGKLEVLRQSDG